MRKGEDYLKALADGRDVRIGGERVASVPGHPAFRAPLKTIEGIFDAHHSGGDRTLLVEKDEKGPYPAWFKLPTSTTDLTRRGQVTDWLASRTWGTMARLYDYSAAIVCGLYESRSELSAGGAAVATRFYERFKNEFLLGTLAFSELPDRPRLQIVERRKDGLVVSGSKTLATGAAHADEILVLSGGGTVEDAKAHPERLLAFYIDPKAKGLTLHCRNPLSFSATGAPSPLAPYDEIDASLEFKNVFVPSDRVLAAGDLAQLASVSTIIHSSNRHSSARRLQTKYRLLCELSRKLVDASGARGNCEAREAVHELSRHHALIARLIRDAEAHGGRFDDVPGFAPDPASLNLAIHYAIENYHSAIRTLDLLGGQRAVLCEGPQAELYDFAAELTGSRFAHRQSLFEHYSLGGPRWIAKSLESLT